MVFDHERQRYERLITALLEDDLTPFQDVGVQLDEDRRTALQNWADEFFPEGSDHVGSGLEGDLFALARHIAQNRQAPRFFEFKQRDEHDLDAIAKTSLDQHLDRSAERALLTAEYKRGDRYWHVLYDDFGQFKSHFDACINRIQAGADESVEPDSGAGVETTPVPPREPSDEVKAQVKKRDQRRCLCCGSTRRLRIDHICARYFGGGHELDNLQTLCEMCNLAKGTKNVSFRISQTPLTIPPPHLPQAQTARDGVANDSAEWEMFLRRTINFFFQCAAVNHVEIGQSGGHPHQAAPPTTRRRGRWKGCGFRRCGRSPAKRQGEGRRAAQG